jgi:hypothetical protein
MSPVESFLPRRSGRGSLLRRHVICVLFVFRDTSHSAIEVITNHRELQSLEAIYILMPTTENIRRIIRDLTPGNQKYSAVHCFFTDRT